MNLRADATRLARAIEDQGREVLDVLVSESGDLAIITLEEGGDVRVTARRVTAHLPEAGQMVLSLPRGEFTTHQLARKLCDELIVSHYCAA